MVKNPRIHISYSDRHFHPDKPRNEKFFYSCSQTAYHLWKCLSEKYPGVTYGNEVPSAPLDLLWTQNEHRGFPNVARIAFIATGANAIASNRQLEQAWRAAGPGVPKPGAGERRSLREVWSNFLAIARSDAVLIKGNQCVLDGFIRHGRAFSGRYALMNNGIVFERQRSFGLRAQSDIFVYPVTATCLRKGAHLLAAAWPRFASEVPSARLLILGREGAFDLRRALAGCPGVEFLGKFESGSESYVASLNRAKWVLFPSLAEGQAGTLLEAMACGCLPVASRESGIDADRYGGLVVDPNTPEMLLTRLREASGDSAPDRHERCLRRMAEVHDWQHFENQVERTTLELLQKPPQPMQSAASIAAQFAQDLLFR